MPWTERELRLLRQRDHLVEVHHWLEPLPPRAWARHRRVHLTTQCDHWHPRRRLPRPPKQSR